MKRTILLTVLFCVGCLLLVAQKPAGSAQLSAQPLGPAAVWNPSPRMLSAIREKCGRDLGSVDGCFLSEMRRAGASPHAVAFARRFANNGLAYVRAFRKAGLIDIAYIEYASRANELNGVLLVNGEPSIINVDSAKFASKENFSGNPTFAALAKEYPQISIWPGDRYHTETPSVKHLESRGQSFVVGYVLRDGCHACAQIGTASLTFTFDERGKIQRRSGRRNRFPALN
jgi:hypothetical protein